MSQLVVLWFLRSLLLLGGIVVFENIPEIYLAIALATVATVGWIACVQYSKFVQHKKKHVEDEKFEEKFAIIPYFLVPILFSALAVFCGLWVGDYLTIRGYVAGEEEIVGAVVAASVVVYSVIDHYIISHVGDALYFQTIEAGIAKSVKQPSDSAELQATLKLLKKLLK